MKLRFMPKNRNLFFRKSDTLIEMLRKQNISINADVLTSNRLFL